MQQGYPCSNSAQAKRFRKSIRLYNNAFGFASLGANIRRPPGNGPPCFRICGQLFHRYGALIDENQAPNYSQLYIIEAANALNLRMANPANRDCDREVMETIQGVLNTVSPYAAAYRNMAEVEREEQARAVHENRPASEVSMVMREGDDRRRYNAPLHEEVAAIFVGNDGAPPAARDIIVYPRNRPLRHIPYTSCNIDPMMYPIIFPRGEPGWDTNMTHVRERATAVRNRLTQLEYYIYRIAIRREFSALHLAGRLFQQFVVDAYVKVEGQRLDFIRRNQQQLRADSYQGLMDHLENVANERNLRAGNVVILPSTFSGSPRNMHQLYLDAMALVAKQGKPDLFLTFTCNPKWPEIVENLLPGQSSSDRPDLVTRVFKLKLDALKKDLKDGVLGFNCAYVDVIEFQKRGLPHAHMLLHLANDYKLRHSDDIDSLICAQIPDQEQEPELYGIIKGCMIHGPCGNLNNNCPCMQDGKCSKNFPKAFNNGTVVNVDGYPSYSRPDNGRTVRVRNIDLDNRWVVPYNPFLCKKYAAHINLEACVSIKSVKYLYKYIYKGYDTAHIEINERIDHDEVKTFLDARYVSAPEATWRLCAFPMHSQSHSIIRLPVHLPNNQRVYFREGGEAAAVERAENNATMLTACFDLNQRDEHARQFLYCNLPYHYVFQKKDKKWVARQRGAEKVVSRMYNANIREGERYFLRVLLLNVPGALSFEDLKTFEGAVSQSFREACLARGLLEDDALWTRTMTELVESASPSKIRKTFAFILIHGEPNNPAELWQTFKDAMIEDFVRNQPAGQAEQSALGKIQGVLRQFSKYLTDFDLPALEEAPAEELPNAEEFRLDAAIIRPRLNPEQLAVADAVLHALTNNNNEESKIFFIDGPGGTGKTFVYNYLIREVIGRNLHVATCAWTGIAATLLYHGKTLHSLFKLPVPVLDGATCNVKPNSSHAEFLRQQDIIVFDEASMIPKYAIEAIDRMFRDICNSNVPFAGKLTLLGGDFRQTLPVVRRARPAEIIDVCLKSSIIWASVRVFHLHTNMRAGLGEQAFSEFLLQLGSGQLQLKPTAPYQGSIEIPNECVLQNNEDIVASIFSDFDGDLTGRVILTPTNDEALEINEQILNQLPGEVKTYYSIDSVVSDDQEEIDLYPLEFLNSLTPSGMPPHALNLKVGCPVMLMRNLSIKDGLCNGTRLITRNLQDNVIDCEILTGVSVGNRVFIPRSTLIPNDTNLPFQMKRIQFPLRLAYALTINKSQGQTFEKVGISLRRPCFSHGQLYVAFSRARAFRHVKVKVCNTQQQGYVGEKCYTKNVVYPQVL